MQPLQLLHQIQIIFLTKFILLQVGSSGSQQSSSPLFDPGALSLALTNVVDKLHRKNKQVLRI